MRKSNKIGECFGQNRCIMVIDRFRGYRTDNEPVIVGNGQLFFTFLMFVSRITDAIAPFFTTIFDPSP